MMTSQQQNPSIPIAEVYWSLLHKADKKFAKIRELPYYHRNRHDYDAYFYKVFKVYTHLWKFQQDHRHKLVDAGLRRPEIGDIASRIAQLYLGQYMRTSQASYLSEAFVFYDAVLTREYFKEGMLQDLNLANKQLRFVSRFLVVCLLLNRRDAVCGLLSQLRGLVDECRRTFQETDFKEWKLVIQEITRFLKADTAFTNVRPLRYSIVLECHPDSLPQVSTVVARRSLRLRDAILTSYHHNEVKFSEITLDTFRMLQCLEWEPSGLFYKPNTARSSQNEAPGSGRINYIQDIADPTLPHNPRKAVLYRPSVTHFLAVLATVCEELPSDGVMLIYLSASGSGLYTDAKTHSTLASPSDRLNSHSRLNKGDDSSLHSSCLFFGGHGNGGISSIYPCDLVPFTRRPLFLVIDSDSSEAFEAINGVQKGETAAMLLSSSSSYQASSVGSFRQISGGLFTLFLTAPLPAFCLLLGIPSADNDMDTYNKAENLLSNSLSDWGSTLATSNTIDPVWAQVLTDPFLRRLILRFIFCRTVLSLYASTYNKKEFIPKCVPSLPASFLPTTVACQTVVLQLANVFGVSTKFNFSEGLVLPEHRMDDDTESLPCS